MSDPAVTEFDQIWADQLDFNNMFRSNPAPTFEERTFETKDLVLHLISECDELLRASGAWKTHRRPRQSGFENRRAVLMEIIDIFKYAMTVAHVQGFTAQEFMAAYWEKSMVVRQRYAEEFVRQINQPTVIVDIDNVLADYIRGFVTWAGDRGGITADAGLEFLMNPRYLTHSELGISWTQYQTLKHEFRVSGGHATLPVMPGAREFLAWCETQHLQIILVTARPIDKYPNLHGETLQWLDRNGLIFDEVWWARDKGEIVLERDIVKHIVFAVDDEEQYVRQLSGQHVFTYWLNGREGVTHSHIDVVASLGEIPKLVKLDLKSTEV
jgi:hypothetical protein